MPDPALMHGRAIPAADLPAGTVTVRVVREAVTNNLPGQTVRLTVNGQSRTATTDADGRAEFPDMPANAEATAEVTVDGEALVSQPFRVPAAGGLRVILVAGLGASAGRTEADGADAAAPPVKGTIVLGGNTRIIMEFRDDSLQVFYMLDIVNRASTRVDIGGPLILDLPTGAARAAVMEGSSEAASVSGDRLTVTGPFAPGSTTVQVAFELLFDSARETIEQRWPAAVEQVAVGIEQVGGIGLSSAHIPTVNEVQTDTGTPFLIGRGPAMSAGDTLVLQLTGLPAHSRTPLYTALILAGAIVGVGVWLAWPAARRETDVRQRLTAQRDTLLGELAQIERRGRTGALDPRNAARRQRLHADLERIYGELDEAGAAAPERGRGHGALA